MLTSFLSDTFVSLGKNPRDFKVKNSSILLSCNKVDYEYITHVFPANILDRLQLIPCGKCMACRINKAEEWSTRCALELLDHEHACFLTLTYDDSFCLTAIVSITVNKPYL